MGTGGLATLLSVAFYVGSDDCGVDAMLWLPQHSSQTPGTVPSCPASLLCAAAAGYIHTEIVSL